MELFVGRLAELSALVDLDFVPVSFGIPFTNQSETGVDHDPLVPRVDGTVVGDSQAVVCKVVRPVFQGTSGQLRNSGLDCSQREIVEKSGMCFSAQIETKGSPSASRRQISSASFRLYFVGLPGRFFVAMMATSCELYF